MKQLLFAAMFLMISVATFGQGTVYNAPITYTNTLKGTGNAYFTSSVYLQGTVINSGSSTTSGASNFTGNLTISKGLFMGIENANTHDYTVLGTSPYVKINTTRLDTIRLSASNLSAGQVLYFYTVSSSNDSTIFIPSAGNINGASTYWLTGTYKTTAIYYDGTNYWVLR